MRDPTALRTLSSSRSAVRISTARVKTLFRLKSWQKDNGPFVLHGRDLPAQVGHTLSGLIRVQCVGPGDWLILSHELPASELRVGLEAGLSGGLTLVDVSDAFACLEVAGSAASDMLSKGCGLDIHPLGFQVGRCARIRFAQVPVVLECMDDSPRFELSVSRSYRQYLHSWLMDAAVEFRDR